MKIENKTKTVLNISILIVEEGNSEDNSVVRLTQKKMDELNLYKAETVFLKGQKETLAFVMPDDSGLLADNKIRMNHVLRRNIGLSNEVSISKPPNVPIGKRVDIRPFADTIKGYTGNLTHTYLIPYFKDTFRPIHKGDTFLVNGIRSRTLEFKVIKTDPENYCIVGDQTVIFIGEPIPEDKFYTT